jgi:hypothetical protein
MLKEWKIIIKGKLPDVSVPSANINDEKQLMSITRHTAV